MTVREAQSHTDADQATPGRDLRGIWSTCAELGGITAISCGFGWFSPGLGLIAAGVGLVGVGFLIGIPTNGDQ